MPHGFVPWASLSPEALDAPVRALVAALNATNWVRTVFSCAGHPEEPDSASRGRRQAHVDVVVADRARWRRFVRQCRREARAAVAHLARLDATSLRLRCAEGSLGPVPDWLTDALPPAGSTASRGWAPLLLRRWFAHGAATGASRPAWEYRRVVFEPVPYDVDAVTCRRVLAAALAAAERAALRA